jgi:uncharacterized membrane protein
MKTVVGLFERYASADQAMNELLQRGFKKQEIGVIVRDGAIDSTPGADETDVAETVSAASICGATIGGIAGLLVGLGTLTIPGIGAVIAAGTLTSVITSTAAGAGVGALAGGLIGALVSLGISEEEAQVYAEGVRRGNVLVVVQTDDARADEAFAVLHATSDRGMDAHAESGA